jgi:hypothetical protein
MAYEFELETGQRVYLEERGTQTVISVTSSGLGQQQQSSSSIQTGQWTSPPEILQTPTGAVIKIITAQGEHQIQIQGNSIGVNSRSSSVGGDRPQQGQQFKSTSTSTSSSFSMSPMESMKMGDMEMNMNPMQMRMGNMEMRMDSKTQSQADRRFCSQCGASIDKGDRFCSSCGHRLG